MTRRRPRAGAAGGGRPPEYRAVAETIGLTDGKGEPTASVFTVSYLAEPAAGGQRPVAFVFNGGPGAASGFLHLGALAPPPPARRAPRVSRPGRRGPPPPPPRRRGGRAGARRSASPTTPRPGSPSPIWCSS